MLYRDFDITLTGSRIRITPMTAADAEPYARLMFGKYYGAFNAYIDPATVSGLKSILDHSSKEEVHAIRPLESDTFIGWITLQHDGEKPDIGISLIQEAQNKGLEPEAIRLLANWIYNAYGLKQIYIRTHDANIQAQKAFRKLGVVLDKTDDDPDLSRMMKEIVAHGGKERDIPSVLHYHLDLPIEN